MEGGGKDPVSLATCKITSCALSLFSSSKPLKLLHIDGQAVAMPPQPPRSPARLSYVRVDRSPGSDRPNHTGCVVSFPR